MIEPLDKKRIAELWKESDLSGDRLIVQGLLKINEIIDHLNKQEPHLTEVDMEDLVGFIIGMIGMDLAIVKDAHYAREQIRVVAQAILDKYEVRKK